LVPEISGRPLVTIEPSKRGVTLNLRDLWLYRDLLFILTLRDIRVRYKQTALGAAWVIIQPLFAMLLFTLFFGRLAEIPSNGVPYPLFAFAGLLPWTFFSNAVSNSGNSLVASSALITKVYFPRMVIPTASVAAGLLDFAIGFAVLIVLMVWYHVKFSLQLALLPLLTLLTALLAIGVGLWVSALNVKYRDVRYTLPFLLQMWFFATPIILPSSIVPAKWRTLLAVNPMAGLVEGYRAACFGTPFDWPAVGVSALITFAVLLYSIHYFRQMERGFADII
jgi:lipopolysaccharide transport system permease protein